MRSIRTAVLALGVVAALVALAGCGSSKTHGAEGTVKLTEPGGEAGKSFGVIGKPTEKSVPAGSGFAFTTPLQNSAKKTEGELNAVCIATQPSKGNALSGTCTGTATVPGGSFALNVGGKEAAGEDVSGAIVGGTGKYNGALGNFNSKGAGGENAPKTLSFNYILP
jgi:hypothetical protein